MSGGRPGRQTVLLWMQLQQAGGAAAAAHFKLPASTIRRWLTEQRQAVAAAPAGERSPSATARAPAQAADKSAACGVDPGKPSAPLDRSARPGLSGMGPDDREHIVGFKRRALAFLDSDKALENPKAARELIGALSDLLGAVPDLLRFDARLSGADDADGGLAGDGPRGGGAAVDRVLAALGGDGPADP